MMQKLARNRNATLAAPGIVGGAGARAGAGQCAGTVRPDAIVAWYPPPAGAQLNDWYHPLLKAPRLGGRAV